MMKFICSRIFFLISGIFYCSVLSFAQRNKLPDYIVWQNNDTSYCYITSIERTSGNVRSIDFINKDGNKIELLNEEEVSRARFICSNNEFYWEYVPVKGKNQKLHRHLEIIENGKIKIYANEQLFLRTKENGERVIANPTANLGGVSSTIKLDNGKYLDINSKNIRNEISPHFLKCPDFNTSFKKKITKQNIVEAARVYNQLCR